MGREVKRVIAGFNWPLGKVWEGFINNPHRDSKKCGECKGSGSSAVARRLKDLWYGYIPFKPEDRGSKPFLATDEWLLEYSRRKITHASEFYGTGESAAAREAVRLAALFNSSWSHHLNQDDVNALVEGGRLMDFTHMWTPETRWQPKDPPYIPTAHEVNIWSCVAFGHDCINQWRVVGAECKRLGVRSTCGRCRGSGQIWSSRGAKARREGWEPQEPPTGDWWQVWETVSEGSPVTPAFPTRDALIDYLVEGGDISDRKYGEGGWTRENAESFMAAEWGPTLIGTPGDLRAPRDGQQLVAVNQ